jgi:hypothetical protein
MVENGAGRRGRRALEITPGVLRLFSSLSSASSKGELMTTPTP